MGEMAKAIALWRKALSRDPDNYIIQSEQGGIQGGSSFDWDIGG